MDAQSRTIVLSFPQWGHSEEVAQRSDKFAAVISELDRITAHCEVDARNFFLFPVRGPARYFGGEGALVQHVHDVMSALFPDATCGVGVGDSRFIARLASLQSCHSGSPVVVASCDTRMLLRSLPVQVLIEHTDIAPDVIAVFQHLGLHTLGRVVDLGETALIDRFGVAGQHVYAIATGQDVDLFVPSQGHEPVVAVCDFDNMSHHALNEAMNDSSIVVVMAHASIVQFVQSVSFQGLQCLRLRISCETDHGEHNERVWCDTRGFAETSITERLSWQLHHWLKNIDHHDHPTSYVSTVIFEALECRSVSADAVTLWDVRSDSTERVVRALARVAVADDKAHVTVPVWKGGRDLFTFEAIDVAQIDLHIDDDHRGKHRAEWNGSVPAPRPITLCDPAIPVDLCDESSRLVVVTGRHELSSSPVRACFSDGTTWDVLAWAGPWPVEERWWDPQRWRRHARVQILVSRGQETAAWLLSLESRQWKITAIYH
jgi:protein ImuB